jgi:hypothetical protein
VKEKYFKTKYRPAGIPLNFSHYDVLNLNYIKNKRIKINLLHLSIFVEACAEKYIKLYLKLRNKKHYYNSKFAHMVECL